MAATRRSSVFYRSPVGFYPQIVRGEGSYLWDDQGNRYLDLSGGISATMLLGSGRPEIAEALASQARRLPFIHNSRVTNDRQEEFAARLVQLAPPGISRVMFSSGGSEANEVALRISRQYHLARGNPKRWKVIGLDMSYHGATMGALAMTGRPGIRHDYLPYLNAFPHIESPITFRGPLRGLDAKEAALRAASRLSDTIENEGPETVAAFIAEPISASRGEALAPDGYWTLIREICDRYGILFIADEIVTGVGRTGGLLCFSHFGIKPDLTTLAKGLGAGYTPLGATLVSDRVADTIAEGGREMQELHTYSGNPLSCAVGVAVLDIIEKEGLLEVAEPKGTYAGQLMDEYLGDLPWFGERRGMGLLRGVEWVRSRETRDPFAKELDVANKLWAGMWRHGVVMGSLRHDNPLVGDFTVLSPALTVSEADLEHGIKVLREVAVEVMGAS